LIIWVRERVQKPGSFAVVGRRDDTSQIEQRGNSYRVNVYAGLDPLTGRRIYLRESTTDLAEARRIRNKFRNQVDEQRHARTKATVRTACQAGTGAGWSAPTRG
jgi:hypothetical protein